LQALFALVGFGAAAQFAGWRKLECVFVGAASRHFVVR
jgi:hypothetical protein